MEGMECRTLVGWFQHSQVCPKCMVNYYSFDGKCRTVNCGNERERDADTTLKKKDDRIIGKVLDKKSHKYLPISKGGLKRC